MKIKDLLKFNPEANIEVIMPNSLPYTGKLTFGWSHKGEAANSFNSKANATEVCIFLGEIKENEA